MWYAAAKSPEYKMKQNKKKPKNLEGTSGRHRFVSKANCDGCWELFLWNLVYSAVRNLSGKLECYISLHVTPFICQQSTIKSIKTSRCYLISFNIFRTSIDSALPSPVAFLQKPTIYLSQKKQGKLLPFYTTVSSYQLKSSQKLSSIFTTIPMKGQMYSAFINKRLWNNSGTIWKILCYSLRADRFWVHMFWSKITQLLNLPHWLCKRRKATHFLKTWSLLLKLFFAKAYENRGVDRLI